MVCFRISDISGFQTSGFQDTHCTLTNCLVVENFRVSSIRIFASQFPNVKETFPIDEFEQIVQREISENFFAQKRGSFRSEFFPIQFQGLFTGNIQRQVDLSKQFNFSGHPKKQTCFLISNGFKWLNISV